MAHQEWPDLNRKTQHAWNKNAVIWDNRMGDDGNDFHLRLVRPATEKLLDIKAGERVLEIACGNGIFARRLSDLGAEVVATDFSEALIKMAKTRTTSTDQITYQVVDATDKARLLALGERQFDAAVANMALMDIAEITPLLDALSQLLKPDGRFVFTQSHPCFKNASSTWVSEQREINGDLTIQTSLKLSSYITPESYQGVAIVGQPELQYYFHRPLSVLLNKCFQVGFVLDGFEEPIFQGMETRKRSSLKTEFQEFPLIMVARLRLSC